jgi:hypothetical protein
MRVECEHCAGELDAQLLCQEQDCGADMKVHWEMTNPQKLIEACRSFCCTHITEPVTRLSSRRHTRTVAFRLTL